MIKVRPSIVNVTSCDGRFFYILVALFVFAETLQELSHTLLHYNQHDGCLIIHPFNVTFTLEIDDACMHVFASSIVSKT